MLIFLHGFLGGPEDWLPVIAHLPCELRCESVDLNAMDPREVAKSFLHAKKATPFYLVGYSMGGRLAWQLAPFFYPALRGLILLGAHPGLTSKEEKMARWEHDKQWIAILENKDMSAFLMKWYEQPLFATMRNKEEVIASRLKRNPTHLAAMMRTMSLALQPRLEIFSPTLFLYGKEDLKYADIYSELACVETIAEAGHAAHLENPRAVADAIRRFVEQNP